jgi:hypothetical protein
VKRQKGMISLFLLADYLEADDWDLLLLRRGILEKMKGDGGSLGVG